MQTYNPIYRKFIDDRNVVMPNRMVRNAFYLIKEYEYVDGTKGKYNQMNAPIIFTLFVSQVKDIVHAVKVSNVRPDLIQKFFGKFANEKTEELEMKGGAKAFYERVVSKVPIITNDSYRTYKLSGFGRIYELDMDINKLTPVNKNITGLDSKSQTKNK